MLGSYGTMPQPALLLLLLLFIYTTASTGPIKIHPKWDSTEYYAIRTNDAVDVLISGFIKRIMRVPDREC